MEGFGQGRKVVARRCCCHRFRTVIDNCRQRAIARYFDIHRPLMACRRRQHAPHFALRGRRVVEDALCDRHFAEHAHLRAEVAHAMMEQRVVARFTDPGRAADHHHRRAFGIGLGGGVDQLQSADAIGHRHRTQAADARIGIGGEAGALFITGTDQRERRLLDNLEQAEHIVAGDTEHVPDVACAQFIDEHMGDGKGLRHEDVLGALQVPIHFQKFIRTFTAGLLSRSAF